MYNDLVQSTATAQKQKTLETHRLGCDAVQSDISLQPKQESDHQEITTKQIKFDDNISVYIGKLLWLCFFLCLLLACLTLLS
jgi:hypothetical protein